VITWHTGSDGFTRLVCTDCTNETNMHVYRRPNATMRVYCARCLNRADFDGVPPLSN
jgi:ribosomal protein S27E